MKDHDRFRLRHPAAHTRPAVSASAPSSRCSWATPRRGGMRGRRRGRHDTVHACCSRSPLSTSRAVGSASAHPARHASPGGIRPLRHLGNHRCGHHRLRPGTVLRHPGRAEPAAGPRRSRGLAPAENPPAAIIGGVVRRRVRHQWWAWRWRCPLSCASVVTKATRLVPAVVVIFLALGVGFFGEGIQPAGALADFMQWLDTGSKLSRGRCAHGGSRSRQSTARAPLSPPSSTSSAHSKGPALRLEQ